MFITIPNSIKAIVVMINRMIAMTLTNVIIFINIRTDTSCSELFRADRRWVELDLVIHRT